MLSLYAGRRNGCQIPRLPLLDWHFTRFNHTSSQFNVKMNSPSSPFLNSFVIQNLIVYGHGLESLILLGFTSSLRNISLFSWFCVSISSLPVEDWWLHPYTNNDTHAGAWVMSLTLVVALVPMVTVLLLLVQLYMCFGGAAPGVLTGFWLGAVTLPSSQWWPWFGSLFGWEW